MKVAGVVVLATLGGCMGVGVRGGMAGSVAGAPTRVTHGALEMNTFLGTKRVLVNPTALFAAGPLDKSETLGLFGARAFYKVRNKSVPLSPFAEVLYGNECRESPCRSSFSISVGGALLAIDDKDSIIPHAAVAFAALTFGVVYRQQEQDDLGSGQFLGVELGIALGVDLLSGIASLIDDHQNRDCSRDLC